MKEIVIVNSAKEDISKALEYYQRIGSGEKKFKGLISKRLEQLVSLPLGLLPKKPEIKSSALSMTKTEQKSFPYHIYYSSTETSLIILRVFHTRQHPKKVFNYSQW